MLAVVGVGAIIAAFCTLQSITDQARAAVTALKINRVASSAAKRSAETAEKALDHAREVSEIQLRAYVHVSAATILNPLEPANRKAQVIIRNFGSTPAFNVGFWLHSWVEEYPLNCVLPEPPSDFPISRDILGPGRISTMELTVAVQNPWAENEIEAGRAAIYVYGKILYRDILKRDRFTDFRFICRGEYLSKGRLAPDTGGNDAN